MTRWQQGSGGGNGRQLASAQLDAGGFELAASGEDVAAAGGSHRRRISGRENNVGKRLDRRVRRAFVWGTRPRVERDQIDFRWNTRQQPDQLPSIARAVVDAFQHDVFEGDPTGIARTRIAPARLEQFGDRVFAVERYQAVANVVAHRM